MVGELVTNCLERMRKEEVRTELQLLNPLSPEGTE
jgi:hypothetical protein